MTFEDLELDTRILNALSKYRYNKPTPIQEATIPLLLEGRDVLAGAATGTGKTAAFVLPMLQHLLDNPTYGSVARVLILAPTRELAFQIHKVVQQLGTHCGFDSTIITGGFSSFKQLEYLKQPTDIIVATPGRLLTLMSQEEVDLSDVQMLIIDEADRMLDMGQGPSVNALLQAIPTDFQAACFSATLTGSGVARFASDILDNPETIQVDSPTQQSAQVQQAIYYADSKEHKQALLKNIINDPSCKSALVFCNKRDKASEVNAWLQSQNISSTDLHGDFIQSVRLDKTHKFKNGKIKVMVATDVAARGLDILNITHVINYDLPIRGDIYIHRVGRTGRAQQVGIALSLVEAHDNTHLQRIQYHLQNKIPVATIEGLEAKIKQDKPTKAAAKKPHKKKVAAKAKKAAKNKSSGKAKKVKKVRD